MAYSKGADTADYIPSVAAGTGAGVLGVAGAGVAGAGVDCRRGGVAFAG